MAEATPPGVIVVDGNHGGAKLPPVKAFAPVPGSTAWDSQTPEARHWAVIQT